MVRAHRADSLFTLARRNFWFLFGGIWLLAGLPFLVSGLYLATQPWRGLIPAFTIAGAVVGGGGAVIMARALAQMRRRIRLDREGVTADAEVVEVVPSQVSINRMAQARIRYRYRDHSGHVHEGRTSMQPAEDAERWRAGDIAIVRFDRTRPQESIWIGKT